MNDCWRRNVRNFRVLAVGRREVKSTRFEFGLFRELFQTFGVSILFLRLTNANIICENVMMSSLCEKRKNLTIGEAMRTIASYIGRGERADRQDGSLACQTWIEISRAESGQCCFYY